MSKSNSKKSLKPVPIDDNIPDLSNDPFVLAKMAKAEKLIAKYGLPETFKTKPKKVKSLKLKAKTNSVIK